MSDLTPSSPLGTSPRYSASASEMNVSLTLKLVFAAVLWGGTFIAGRVVATAMPHTTAAFVRFFIAAILLLVYVRKKEGALPRLSRSELAITAALGFTGIYLYNMFFLAALTTMAAGRTALFVSLCPIVTALLACVFFRERLGLLRWTGIAIALIGTMVVITRGGLFNLTHDGATSFGVGELMMCLAVVAWAAYTLISRKAVRTLTPMTATMCASLWGLVFLLPGTLAEVLAIRWTAISMSAWAAIIYLGTFGTVVPLVWYYEGVKVIGPSRTAVFTNLNAVFGVLLAALILREPILASMLVGGAITGIGVALANKVRKRL
ncbi:DMT family transporter [Burkholderia sp. Ax-1719]|uniref:DMT family transporter n=1 Tax=Burkholderia sp. Ax-1719 TaxID=2608334 RepID=UPI00141E3683|nr:DMT family transporter [Burkholderia sp. Ax-1719]NIE63162.1 DMT family transporter [Burkholderia sp. Ax-1719]